MLSERYKPYRKTGIDILSDVPWGTHLCLFYESKQDLIDILVPYFKAGLEGNEFCMWVTSEPLNAKEAQSVLRCAVPDMERYLKAGQIEIIPHNQWYLEKGVFNPQKVITGWIEKIEQAASAGFNGIRVSGSTAWLEAANWSCFADYERTVDDRIGEHNLLAICSYDLNKCSASDVVDVAGTHGSALIRRNGTWALIGSHRQKKAEEKIKLLSKAIQGAINAIIVTDMEGNITYVNPAGEIMYGYVDGQLIGKHVSALNPEPEKAEEIISTLAKAGSWGGEILQQKKIGETFPALVSLSTVKDEKGNPIAMMGAVTDITMRKQSEKALRETQTRYRTLFENLPQKIFVKDTHSAYLLCNENYARDLEIKAEEITDKTDYDFFPKGLADKYRADDERIMESGQAGVQDEKYIRGGRETFTHTVKTPLKDDKGMVVGILGVSWDVTAERRAHEKLLHYQRRLRDLTSEMSLMEERERRRLAVGLHDHVTQELIHFKISLGSLVQKGLPAELAGPLDEIYRQLDQIVHRIRSLTFDLSSATLYELGLEAAVREYLYDQVQRGYGIHTEFEDDARPKHLTDDVRALLYRAIRELLINVVKHSRARKVKVTTTRDNGNIRVEVIDDGIGFVPSKYLSKTGGLGLFSICERLDYLGGSMEVDARPGQGTHITLIAPVRLESVEKNVDKDHHEDKNSGSGQSWNSPTGNRRFN